MRTDTNPMVYRWLVDIQEFDFTLEDILGKDNPVADCFSRLVANNMPSDIIAMLSPPPKISEQLLILIGKVHNSISGHHGLERTLRMLTTPSSTCPCCQKMSMLKLPIHAHPFTTSHYYPMEALNIDFIGPFPDKAYVMSIIDIFTRWMELYYSPIANGKSAAQHLFQYFGRFGAPTQLLSDRGSHFVNEVIEEFTSLVGTEHCLTLSYSSQQNAIVERVNKEINRHLRKLSLSLVP
jgi:hypothetical protein